jgi:NarL family two-component system response regulator LiaR
MSTPEQDRIKVVIVDDHAVVRQGVKAFLVAQDDIRVVSEAESGAEAIHLCAEYSPDIVLMDMLLPDMDGVEATREIKRVSPRTAVIVLTSYHDDKYVLPAMKAGALSYLLKDISSRELIAAIRKAAKGDATIHPGIASQIVRGLQTADIAAPQVSHDLTCREVEVLSLVAVGLPNCAIAEKLFISEFTVKSHVSSILGKLQVADRTQAAAYAWREGIVKSDKSNRG